MAGAAATVSAWRSSAPAVAALARPEHGEQVARSGRADALVQSEQPVPRDLVGAVVEQAQSRHEVLDVRGFEELQPAELDEGHPARSQLDLEQVAVVAGPHQHRLIVQPLPGLDGLQNRIGNQTGFAGRVVAADESRARATCPVRVQPQRELAGAYLVGEIEQGLP